MKDNAVLQRRIPGQGTSLALAPLVLVVLLLAGLAGSASAAQPVGKDGRVYACYKAKGKQKGSVRLVAKKARCGKKERKISWGVAGPQGAPGAPGAAGAAGAPGQAGAAGPQGQPGPGSGTQVGELLTRVEVLESTLEGVTSGLPTLESTVGGLTTQVGELCSQAGTLTTQVNGVRNSLNSLIGNLLGSVVSIVLGSQPPPPEALDPFSCTTP